MTDTVAILNTIRATFADSEPKRFKMSQWFSARTQCGCIIGISLTAQPLLARQLGLSLSFVGSSEGILHHADESLTFFCDDWARVMSSPKSDAGLVFAEIFGVSEEEAHFLFNSEAYKRGTKSGKRGHAEALRRLDEVIARYSAKAAEPVRETVAA